ncbi:bifunctional 4-hydroxy-2-oxoglutarate aldolase/2-dehydro-3-deoxy-phosphogluconate aldolase [Umezawaea tangerina]|uniref:2-keto-3-deoxy-phosphogluconate aldolase n=1 Tax=Umezawaea tangerina TaxID=84725 RepID=A0A2T0TG96_9PSEU|nr:bifunctional 4-hydroxy-2-oxoglutarate aldolase/2-dehydro-3-deoxy-phosphogluconate aldolase [Umezawaea tangerina]PRY44706.1 2-keto-3-deoxy-phosphogluconate aldolase [Umezawaea tangerina]
MRADPFTTHLDRLPVLVILRGHDPTTTVRLCEHAASLGVGLVEVPWHGEESRASLTAALDWARDRPGVLVGAGTVTGVDVLRAVHALGVAFTVAPGFDAGVVEAAAVLGVAHLPGVATGTEVSAALAAGCVWQKAFPASVLTPAWFTALRGPFPGVRFVATGGVDAGNAADFLRAGASAVALGSAFSTADPAVIRSLAD